MALRKDKGALSPVDPGQSKGSRGAKVYFGEAEDFASTSARIAPDGRSRLSPQGPKICPKRRLERCPGRFFGELHEKCL